jgi:hypothetical protein
MERIIYKHISILEQVKIKLVLFIKELFVITIHLQNNQQFKERIKLSVTRASTEFCALDGRTFDVTKDDGFQGLVKVLLHAGQSLRKSQFDRKELLPHPTTVKK